MYATNGNKVYTVDETNKDAYRKAGYDIVSDDGKVIAYGLGKTVPMEKYLELEEKYNALLAKTKGK